MVRRAIPVALILVASMIAARAGASETGTADSQGTTPSPVAEGPMPSFAGEVDVNVVNLHVAVVDADGDPVAGLTRDDFEVFEDGRRMEITNFAAVDTELPDGTTMTHTLRAGAEPGADAATQGVDQPQRMVALLFDGPSLQQRNRRRVARALSDYVRENAGEDDRFLIAVNDGGLDVMQAFTDDGALLAAQLEAVEDRRCAGEAMKNEKRHLKRTIFQTDIYRLRGSQMTGLTIDVQYSQTQLRSLLSAIEAVRHREYERIRQALGVAEQLLVAFSGVPGRKSVVWVVEDLAVRPAVDLYQTFYQLALPMRTMMSLVPPEVWGREVELTREFQRVAAAAQAAEATFFIVDASDRDREMGHADFSPPSDVSFMVSQSFGESWTPGADLASVRDQTEGAQYIALATGGADLTSGRNMKSAISRLEEQLRTYYSIGYARPEPPDGERHTVQVKVTRPGVWVRHHEKIVDRTDEQRLADTTLSQLFMDSAVNPLEMAVHLGDQEPTEKTSRYVQAIEINIPIDKLVLLPEAEYHMGQILVAVSVLGGDGEPAAPQLLRLRLTVPDDKYSPDSIASQTVRLLMEDGASRIAVSVRDEISGVVASESVDVVGRTAPRPSS